MTLDEDVTAFCDVTQLEDRGRAAAILQAYGGDLQAAIQGHFSGDTAPQARPTPPTSPPASPRPEPPARSAGPLGGVADLVRVALSPLARLVNGGEGTPESPQRAAEQFIDGFDRQYGSTRPDFCPQAYRGAVRSAHDQGRFLLVYLHAPEHGDTDRFCRGTLCNEALVGVVNPAFVVWGGSVESADAYQVSQVLHATAFPFLALLACSENTVAIAELVEGAIDPEPLLQRLTAAMMEHQGTLDASRASREQRSQERELRTEQDQEYLAAVEADRQRQEETRRRQEEAAAETRRQAEAEEEARREAEREQQELQAKRHVLAEEPAPGPGVSRLRFNLPDGKKAERRFPPGCSVADVRTFVDVLLADLGLADSIRSYELASAYPRRVLADPSMSLEELELVPQGVVHIQPL